MPILVEEGPWEKPDNDLEAIIRLQNILLAAAEGAREGEIDLEYQAIRSAILANPDYRNLVPSFVKTNRDLVSMWPFFKSFDGSWEPRRKMVRGELMPLMDRAEEAAFSATNVDALNAADWTGLTTAKQRLVAIKTLVPVTQASIMTLIATLETPNHNGAPALDEHRNAIENLRELYKKLGEILELEDENRLNSSLGAGLLAAAAKYGKRAARELRNDPMPYAVSAMLLAVLTTFGAPGIAGYMAGVALNIRKTNSV